VNLLDLLEKLSSPAVALGLALLIMYESQKRKDRHRLEKRDANGGNPVVNAIKDLKESTRDQHMQTRERLTECFGAMDRRLAEHERACAERQSRHHA